MGMFAPHSVSWAGFEPSREHLESRSWWNGCEEPVETLSQGRLRSKGKAVSASPVWGAGRAQPFGAPSPSTQSWGGGSCWGNCPWWGLSGHRMKPALTDCSRDFPALSLHYQGFNFPGLSCLSKWSACSLWKLPNWVLKDPSILQWKISPASST